ncbi:MAG: DUF2167 domain-containing protein [Bacteroidetes bacterium]|nr:DUF2167 domain-containing protein [Bacteroidota bacterium]
MKKFISFLSLLLIVGPSCVAQDNDTTALTELVSRYMHQDSLLKTFNYKQGTIVIGDNLATIKVPEGCLFLDAKEGRSLLEDVYLNPPNTGCLGVLLSDTPNLMAELRWLVEYTYSDDGHVKDDDAKETKYDELLEKLKKEADEVSIERVKMGYSSEKLINWAQTPFYDSENKKLHWAMEYEFGGDSLHTLNYNVRVLGRKGYLMLNIISSMSKLPEVNNDINKILNSTNFNAGSQYAEFDSKIDKIAEYGIGGLIAGGILAKTGILAKVGIFLLKFLKIILLALGGLFITLKNKIFGRKKQSEEKALNPNQTPETPAE